jgi:nicotinamide mononucleotide transporter
MANAALFLVVFTQARIYGAAALQAVYVVVSVYGLFLKHRTDAALPFPDAATTAFSLVGQWMATRKWLENWLVWIFVDAVYVAMYVSQRLYPTAGLYAAFLVLATLGYREWRSSMRAHRGAGAAA